MKKINLKCITALIIGTLFTTQIIAKISLPEAKKEAVVIATSSTEIGGLGCNKAIVVKSESEYARNDIEVFRIVLYADCIPCLHVFMFNKDTGEKVLSESVEVLDPYWHQITCVLERNHILN